MYKKILIDVPLADNLAKSDRYIPLPLDIGLGQDDWTYLAIVGVGVEIVKVVRSEEGKYAVVRGLEGTKIQGFVVGDTIKYVPTVLELRDRQTTLLILDSLGIVRVAKNRVSILGPTVIGLGGIEDGLPIRYRKIAKCCRGEAAPALPVTGLRITGDGRVRMVDDGRTRITR